MITSLQNPIIKHIYKLQNDSQFCQEQKQYVVEGIKTVREIIQAEIEVAYFIYTSEYSELNSVPSKFKPVEVSKICLAKISKLKTPQNVLVVLNIFPKPLDYPKKPILICDGIQDPGNLGTLIRTVDAMMWEGIICVNQCAYPYSSKVIRASMGSHLRVAIWEYTVEQLLELKLKAKILFIGADVAGESIKHWKKPNQNYALLVGSEGQGLSSDLLSCCDQMVSIPMKGSIDSLNAAIAAAILMFTMNS